VSWTNITQGYPPGIHRMPAEVYHRDRTAISSSGARKLLPPHGCPARFRYDQDHPEVPTREMDLGTAAHKLVLGIGPELVLLDADDYRKPSTRDERDYAREQGKLALLPHEYDQVQEMAGALHDHPTAAMLLEPGTGWPEQALFWSSLVPGPGPNQPPVEVRRKCLLDWLSTRRQASTGRLLVPDYKTAKSAEQSLWMKDAKKFGCHQQAAWNMGGIRALGIDDDPLFLFIVQEKKPPYLVSVIEMDSDAIMWGGELNEHALQIYRKCVLTGRWPSYSDDIILGHLPKYAEYEHAETKEFLSTWLAQPDGTLQI
jgi:hypothetical protein